MNKIIRFFLEHQVVTFLILGLLFVWGISTAPFDWSLSPLPRNPVAVDAIPDIGENQQIVYTEWPGRSPQDVEDQVTYPLTTSLLGLPGVKTIRSSSMFGASSIYIIFEEDMEFYWSRSRILEKLNALSDNLLPAGVNPQLGPDATALGQVYWYTMEGRDKAGKPTGGWSLQERRRIQDFYVRYGLSTAEGVSEVASVGGHVQEYQVDLDKQAMNYYGIELHQLMAALRKVSQDVGAKTLEVNQVEYFIRGLGEIDSLQDLREAVVGTKGDKPVLLKQIAEVKWGPAQRRGVLDKGGAEAVGGVVITRDGANPMQVIKNLKGKIKELSPGLPSKTLQDGRQSKLTIVPFYDRSKLIQETLGTLEEALTLQILISVLVVLVLVMHLRASFLIAGLLPLSVLLVFILMRYLDITANIVALSGIAIAIGTMVDLGIIFTENLLKHQKDAPDKQSALQTVLDAAQEVAPAILTAVMTTVVSFIPVFALQGAEGKLFGPLAYTKTFALLAALLVSLLVLPSLAHRFLAWRMPSRNLQLFTRLAVLLLGVSLLFTPYIYAAIPLILLAGMGLYEPLKGKIPYGEQLRLIIVGLTVLGLLAAYWRPLGLDRTVGANALFIALPIAVLLVFMGLLIWFYKPILLWCLGHKKAFLFIPLFVMLLGLNAWLGFGQVFRPLSYGLGKLGWEIEEAIFWQKMTATFPGLGEEFMPTLQEGSFLLMPTTTPHAGMEQSHRMLRQLDILVAQIPEVKMVVGKLGRAETALDPAPISMFENLIQYKSEYATDSCGKRLYFAVDVEGHYLTKNGDTLSQAQVLLQGVENHQLIRDASGALLRQWRAHIQSPQDIWDEIAQKAQLPGLTAAPKLQPIETRLVMLQTGMRAPMGIKIFGPDLQILNAFGQQLEQLLKQVPGIRPGTVQADQVSAKPYLLLEVDRPALAQYGLTVEAVKQAVAVQLGGLVLDQVVQGRERYNIRLRYPREWRDSPKKLLQLRLNTPSGERIKLGQVVHLDYEKGPQAIKSEENFLVAHVLFDKEADAAPVEVVEAAQAFLNKKIKNGELQVPEGVRFRFSGSYENQLRAEKRLSVVVPVVLLVIFLILYLQFRQVSTTLMIFAGIAMAFSGGFVLLWAFGQASFMDVEWMGHNIRDLFQVKPVNLSVAVWVGFIALFGIATDDGVLMATYLDQSFKQRRPGSQEELLNAVVAAGQKRIRPAVATTATTLIALLPVFE